MDKDRHLAAIVFSDIHKFTEMMGRNENLMMRLLHEHNRIFEDYTNKYHGRIVKSTGDGFLIEFSSATNALKCCLNIQKALGKLNAGKGEEAVIGVRIGIHLGEVIVHGQDIFGAGVNIASRLELLADPGGICISNAIYNSVRSSLSLQVENLGPISLKHVTDPVEVFKVVAIQDDDSLGVETPVEKETEVQKRPAIVRASEIAGLDREKYNNQVVVLPFKVLSTKPEDAHLGEGFAEALIFGIAREKQLIVHPLESIIALREQAADYHRVADILGATFIVTGVIQRAGPTLQIQVRLIRVKDDKVLHSDSISASEDEIFLVQTKVVKDILYNIVQRISDEVHASLATSIPKSKLAGEFYLKGSYQNRSAITWLEKKQAIAMLEKAVNADKSFAPAHAKLAKAYSEVYGRWQKDNTWIEKAKRETAAALKIDPELFLADEAMANICMLLGDLDEAESYLFQAISLRPESTATRKLLSEVYARQGKLDAAQTMLEEAMLISKECGDRLVHADILNRLGLVTALQGFYLKALEFYDEAMNLAKRDNHRHLEAGIRMNMGVTYRSMGKAKLAINSFEQSIAMLRELGDKMHLAGALGNIGWSIESFGELNRALSLYEEGLLLAREIGDHSTEAQLLTNMGQTLGNLGRNSEAIEAFTKAISLRRESGEKLKEARALIDLAAVYCDLGDHKNSLATYEEAYNMVTDTGDYPMLAAVLLNIGEIYEFGGDPSKALNYYNEAEKVFAKFDASQYQPYLHLYRGRIYIEMQEHEKAEMELMNIIGKGEVKPTVLHRAEIYLAVCREISEEDEDQLQNITSAVEALENIGSYPELIEAYRAIGGWLIEHNQRDQALKYLAKGKKLAIESGMASEAKLIEELMAD